MNQKLGSKVNNWVINIILLVGGIFMLIPFFWCFSTSLRSPAESFDLPPKWLPIDPGLALENYQEVFSEILFPTFLWNSFKVASLITIGQLAICSMAAFAFARLRFPGRDIFFMVFLSGMMIAMQVTIIPIFILMRYLHLVNTHSSLILPAIASPFAVFLLRQYFLSIPPELEDAAKLDGAGYFTIFSRIFLPLASPGLAALGIFTFNYHWNEYFRPLIFLSSQSKMTLPLGLVLLRGLYGISSLSVVLAGVILAILPVLAAFFFAQKYLIEGITLTGIKG